MATTIPINSNEFIEQQLDERICAIEDHFSAGGILADSISFAGPILFGVDNLIRNAVEAKKEKASRNKLVFILTTTGGYSEVVHRIVDTVRHHYKTVDFIIPDYAYSAGTVLVMSGDEIYMDYYSRLGPIDPQIENPSGKMLPALGYLEQYKRLIDIALGKAKGRAEPISPAEVQLLISAFDQAELYKYEQERELSIALLKEWLPKYKFKNWVKTETKGIAVTDDMRNKRAVEIAEELNKTERWHVHGYGISMEVLRRELNIKIEDFGQAKELDEKIWLYHNLLDDYMIRRENRGVLHIDGSYQPFV
ncbi:MAG: serine dehydrogenasease [Sedimentisphaerales bacterium]